MESAGQRANLSAFSEIPVIDINDEHASSDKRAELAKRVVTAAEQVGFMYIVGHGIPDDVVDGVFRKSAEFFDQTDEQKRRIHITRSEAFRGYLGLLEKGNDPTFKGNNLEAFHCAEEVPTDSEELRKGSPLRGPNLWPEIEGFREVVYGYYQRTYQVGTVLLELLAEGMGQPSDFFTRHYTRSISQLRLLKYAQIDDPTVELLARSHCDTGVITILSQDPTGGLQVLNKAGEWIAAPPLKGSYIINIGNTLQAWSGGRFSSTNHRVANRGGVARYSVPFFMTPDFDTEVQPIGSSGGPNNGPFHVGRAMLATYNRIWPAK